MAKKKPKTRAAEAEVQTFGPADSMEAAVAALARANDVESRLTLEEIKRAKTGGCPAFRGSRVYIDELLPWWEENGATLPTGDPELDNIQKQIQREKLRKQKFENDVAEGRYILRADQAEKLGALALELKATLRKKLEEEYPDRLAQKSREEVLRLNRDLVDELCRTFQKGVDGW